MNTDIETDGEAFVGITQSSTSNWRRRIVTIKRREEKGTQAIAAYYGAVTAPFSHIKSYVQEVIVCGQEAAVNWKIRLKTTTGKVIIIDGMGVFKFNQAGKLQSVREFWDLAAFLAQLQD